MGSLLEIEALDTGSIDENQVMVGRFLEQPLGGVPFLLVLISGNPQNAAGSEFARFRSPSRRSICLKNLLKTITFSPFRSPSNRSRSASSLGDRVGKEALFVLSVQQPGVVGNKLLDGHHRHGVAGVPLSLVYLPGILGDCRW